MHFRYPENLWSKWQKDIELQFLISIFSSKCYTGFVGSYFANLAGKSARNSGKLCLKLRSKLSQVFLRKILSLRSSSGQVEFRFFKSAGFLPKMKKLSENRQELIMNLYSSKQLVFPKSFLRTWEKQFLTALTKFFPKIIKNMFFKIGRWLPQCFKKNIHFRKLCFGQADFKFDYPVENSCRNQKTFWSTNRKKLSGFSNHLFFKSSSGHLEVSVDTFDEKFFPKVWFYCSTSQTNFKKMLFLKKNSVQKRSYGHVEGNAVLTTLRNVARQNSGIFLIEVGKRS